jgi:hypothetical protein
MLARAMFWVPAVGLCLGLLLTPHAQADAAEGSQPSSSPEPLSDWVQGAAVSYVFSLEGQVSSAVP